MEVEVYVLGEDAVVPDDGRLVAHTAETFDYGGLSYRGAGRAGRFGCR